MISERSKRRFLFFNTLKICREIQTRIDRGHPNLLFLHGWLLPEPGVLYVVMEKADTDVTTALQEGLMPLKTRLKIAVDVANGMKAIHSAQFIHQDIKADSILVSTFNRPRSLCRGGTREWISTNLYIIRLTSNCSIRLYVCAICLLTQEATLTISAFFYKVDHIHG